MIASLAREHLLDRWEQRYEGRTDWAENAVAQHLEGFDPEVRDRLATRDREATIALYGPTQVGKTTLILKMLGVSDAAALTVGEVLRGGRPAGESATATAMRYRASTTPAGPGSTGPTCSRTPARARSSTGCGHCVSLWRLVPATQARHRWRWASPRPARRRRRTPADPDHRPARHPVRQRR